MKKVIFVGLLSLFVCLSQAATQLETPAQAAITPNATATDPKAHDAKPDPTTTVAAATNETAPIVVATQNATTPNATHVSNETSAKATNETKPAAATNATETKTTVVPPNHVEPAKDKTDNKTVVPITPNNATATDANKDAKKNETTTPKGGNVSPTTAPVVVAASRAFDGPSFIGGIILTLGLLAIGFMGFKYYKNQTERNYHTL